MATPLYQGAGQPSADSGSGWFGRIGSFFGGGTPAYQPAPVAKPTEGTPADSPAMPESQENARIACGPFAIIVPRAGHVTELPQP